MRGATPIERFWSSVDLEMSADDCWVWRGRMDRYGYGKFHLDGREHGAHRFAYELLVGEIPAGLVIDHLCRVRNCVNPRHMEPVTNDENLQRSSAINRNKTHCKRGHPLSGDNLRVWQGWRTCLACKRAREKAA